MSALNPIRTPSRLERAGEYASDLVILTALAWAIPLLLALVSALIRFLAS